MPLALHHHGGATDWRLASQERDDAQLQREVCESQLASSREELDRARRDFTLERELLNDRLAQAANDLEEARNKVPAAFKGHPRRYPDTNLQG